MFQKKKKLSKFTASLDESWADVTIPTIDVKLDHHEPKKVQHKKLLSSFVSY